MPDKEASPPGEDGFEEELVDFARLVKELGWPAFKVRLAVGRLGDRLSVVRRPTLTGRGRNRTLYPLDQTLTVLREAGQALHRGLEEEDERVPLSRVVEEVGWSPNTVKRYLSSLKRQLVIYPGVDGDQRKKLYPLRHTTSLLRREHGRAQARRQRVSDDAASYWMTLSSLKVSAGQLRQLSRDLSAIESEVAKAFRALRDRPPRSEVELTTLPDVGLALVRPLVVMVAPLRLIYWKASVPETGLRGEGRSVEEAVSQLRVKLVTSFRDLQQDPDRDRDLWGLLNELIRERSPRTQQRSLEEDGVSDGALIPPSER
ncbi:MAG: hypothetical protein ACJ76N_29540 [Thermoanaerobaculia bacterium]